MNEHPTLGLVGLPDHRDDGLADQNEGRLAGHLMPGQFVRFVECYVVKRFQQSGAGASIRRGAPAGRI